MHSPTYSEQDGAMFNLQARNQSQQAPFVSIEGRDEKLITSESASLLLNNSNRRPERDKKKVSQPAKPVAAQKLRRMHTTLNPATRHFVK